MKVALLVFLGTLLLCPSTSVILQAETRNALVIPGRQLAEASADEQKVIDFVLNTFEEIVAPGEKADHFYFNQAKDKLDEAVGVPPPHKFGDKLLATYYFKLTDKNAAARKIKKDHVLFWVHVAQGGKPAATTGQNGDAPKEGNVPKPSKKSTKDITFEFTNGVVSSKIKVQYGFGGMELLKNFIIRSCFNYWIKVEQSVFGLVSVEPMLTLFTANIEDIFLGDKAAESPYKLVSKQVASSLSLSYEGYKDLPVPETLPGIKKVVDGTVEAMKKSSKGGDKGAPEFLVYEIKPEITAQNPEEQPDYATYIDVFYLIAIKVGGRVVVMVHSKHFSDSIEVSVNSKQTIVDTVYNLCHKVLLQTYQNFLDLEPKGDICPNGVVYMEKKGVAKLGLEPGNANPGDKSGEEDGTKVTHYKKDLGGNNWLAVSLQIVDNADVKVVVQLLKLSEDGATASTIIRRQNYFPYMSQYCMGVFIMSFVEKVKEDFSDLAYSEAIRKPDLAKGEEEKKIIRQNLGLKFSAPFIPDIQFTAGNTIDLTSMRDAQGAIEDCPEGINNVAPAAAAGKWQAQLCVSKASTPRKVGVIMKALAG